MKALIVNDNAVNRSMPCLFFQRRGWTVIEVQGRQEGRRDGDCQ